MEPKVNLKSRLEKLISGIREKKELPIKYAILIYFIFIIFIWFYPIRRIYNPGAKTQMILAFIVFFLLAFITLWSNLRKGTRNPKKK